MALMHNSEMAPVVIVQLDNTVSVAPQSVSSVLQALHVKHRNSLNFAAKVSILALVTEPARRAQWVLAALATARSALLVMLDTNVGIRLKVR